MKKVFFLKYIIGFSLLLWSANTTLFADTSSLIDIESNVSSFSIDKQDAFSYIQIPSSNEYKSLDLIEAFSEEILEKNSFENKTFLKTYFLNGISSLKSEEIEHKIKTSIAFKGYFPCFFTYKSLYIKFCTYRI